MVRTWVRALSVALATAAAVGAGQLGIAYGLGLVRWEQQFGAGNENAWSAQLTWAAWISAVAVVSGAVAGVATLRRHGRDPHFGSWLAAALVAGVGAGAIVPLMTLPARAAELPQTTDPALEAGLAAGVGAVAGIFAALAVLCARLIAGNVYATVGWVWAVALVSASAVLTGDSPLGTQRLGVLSLPVLNLDAEQDLITPLTVGLAVTVGGLIAAYGRWLGEHRLTVAASGLAGPALLAVAYLAAGPGTSGDHSDQIVPYTAALFGVGAGLLTAVLVAVVRRPRRAAPPVAPVPGEQPTEDAAARVPLPAMPSPAMPPPARDEDYVSWVSDLGRESPEDHPALAKPSKRSEADRSSGPGKGPKAEPEPEPDDEETMPILGRPYVSQGRAKAPSPPAQADQPPRGRAKAPNPPAQTDQRPRGRAKAPNPPPPPAQADQPK